MSKLYEEYLKLKKENRHKLYLFRCWKFYIFLDQDCDKINDYLVLKKTVFANDVYKCGFPVDVLDHYLRVFQNHGLDVVIVDFRDDIFEQLKSLNLDNITPIEAFQKLKEVQEAFNE